MVRREKLESLKNNLFFAANLMVFSNIISYYLVGSELFSQRWLISSFILIFSYSVYTLFSDVFITIKEENIKLRRTKNDAIRYLTIYTIYQLFVVFIEKGIFELSLSWIMKTFIIVGSYLSFDFIFSDFMFNLNNNHILFIDLIKIVSAEIIGAFIISQELTLIDSSELIAYLFSYSTWNLFTKNFIN
jgi:hypothetical protein